MYPFSILDFGIKRQKKKPKSHRPPHENVAFWIELNTPIKILVFCISSFQNSWHFAFCISWGTKHSLSLFLRFLWIA
jgi:hypothetical protein